MTIIYGLLDPRNGELRYVGKANDPARRLILHLNQAKARRCYSHRWIMSVRDAGYRPKMVTLQELAPTDDWREAERAWIKHFRLCGARLTNTADGGEGNSGWKASPETRARMSAAATKRCADPVERARLASISNGTPPHGSGERNGSSKFTEAQVVEMRERTAKGESLSQVAAAFNTSKPQISFVVTGRTWKDTPGPIRPLQRRAKLSEAQVQQIRDLLRDGVRHGEIAHRYGVSEPHISDIATGRRHPLRSKEVPQ